MSTALTSRLALAALLAGGIAVAAPALADQSAAAPEYLFRLPERVWILGGRLSENGTRCGAEQCEAGYHSGDLVLSVRRAGQDVQAVGAMRGCPSVAVRVLPASTLEPLSPADQYTRIQHAALVAARAARTQCGSRVTDLIDTAALVNVAPGMAPRR